MNVLVRPDGFFKIIGPTRANEDVRGPSDEYVEATYRPLLDVHPQRPSESTTTIRYQWFRRTDQYFDGGKFRTVNFFVSDLMELSDEVFNQVEMQIRGIHELRIEWDRKPTSLVENEIRRKALGIKAGVLFTLFSPDPAGMVSVALDMFESSDGNLAAAKAYLNGEITGPEIA